MAALGGFLVLARQPCGLLVLVLDEVGLGGAGWPGAESEMRAGTASARLVLDEALAGQQLGPRPDFAALLRLGPRRA